MTKWNVSFSAVALAICPLMVSAGMMPVRADGVDPEVLVSIQFDKPSYRSGEPVPFKIELENRSKVTAYFGDLKPSAEVSLVRLGEAVPTSLYGTRGRLPSSLSPSPGIGVVGKTTLSFSDNLARYFDLSLPGEYTAVVRKRQSVELLDGRTEIVQLTSPAVKFTVSKDEFVPRATTRTTLADGREKKGGEPVNRAAELEGIYGRKLFTGIVRRIEKTPGGNYRAEISEVDMLWGDPVGGQITVEIPVVQGHPPVASPREDWIGKSALLYVTGGKSGYQVGGEGGSLSPDGSPFYVWKADAKREIEQVRVVSRYFGLEQKELHDKLIEYVEGPGVDFLKLKAIEYLWYANQDENPTRASDLLKFRAWRDQVAFSWKLRMTADFSLWTLIAGYKTEPDRLRFLRSAVESHTIDEASRAQAVKLLRESQAIGMDTLVR